MISENKISQLTAWLESGAAFGITDNYVEFPTRGNTQLLENDLRESGVIRVMTVHDANNIPNGFDELKFNRTLIFRSPRVPDIVCCLDTMGCRLLFKDLEMIEPGDFDAITVRDLVICDSEHLRYIPSGSFHGLHVYGELNFNNLPNLTSIPDDVVDIPGLSTIIVTITGLTTLPQSLGTREGLECYFNNNKFTWLHSSLEEWIDDLTDYGYLPEEIRSQCRGLYRDINPGGLTKAIR